MSGNELQSKFIYVLICEGEEGGSEGLRTQKFSLYESIIESPKLYNIFTNQLPRSIKRKNMMGFPLFYLERGLFLPYILTHLS